MHKKRGYNRETPNHLVRDYTLFAIACEGSEREANYFKMFEHMSNKVVVDIIEDDTGNIRRSAPNWLLDRAAKYIDKEQLLDTDRLWFVMDVDRWNAEQIRKIAEYCNQYPNWNIAISNPCFEIWLCYHIKSDLSRCEAKTSQEIKAYLGDIVPGGYNKHKFIKHVREAIKNAEAKDSNPNHFMPKVKETKVYQLAEAALLLIGINRFNIFIEQTLPKLIKNENRRRYCPDY